MSILSTHQGIYMLVKFSFALLLLASNAGLASLGGDESSLHTDHLRLRASTLKRTQASTFTVHESQSQDGIVIREYASPQGKIFAVTWKGPLMPDLKQLLGQYFQPYLDHLQSHGSRSHRAIHLKSEELVVHSGGRLRAFFGVAYLPQSLPEGVRIEDLQ